MSYELNADFQNALHHRAAYVIKLETGYYVGRRSLKGTLSSGGLHSFSTRAAAEDYILDMIEWRLGAHWTKARIVAL